MIPICTSSISVFFHQAFVGVSRFCDTYVLSIVFPNSPADLDIDMSHPLYMSHPSQNLASSTLFISSMVMVPQKQQRHAFVIMYHHLISLIQRRNIMRLMKANFAQHIPAPWSEHFPGRLMYAFISPRTSTWRF